MNRLMHSYLTICCTNSTCKIIIIYIYVIIGTTSTLSQFEEYMWHVFAYVAVRPVCRRQIVTSMITVTYSKES